MRPPETELMVSHKAHDSSIMGDNDVVHSHLHSCALIGFAAESIMFIHVCGGSAWLLKAPYWTDTPRHHDHDDLLFSCHVSHDLSSLDSASLTARPVS